MEKTDFFISPAYEVPTIITNFFSKLTAIRVSEEQPCLDVSALKLGISIITNSGLKLDFSSYLTSISKFCINKECQAYSVYILVLNR